MGARYLTDLAAVLAGAGLAVTAQDGWQTRGRSSGGFDGDRPWCIMWHHAASAPGASTESVANYASYGSDVAPVCNIVLGRAGDVIVCAAGATNTNGAGNAVAMSRGVVPADQMNTHAIGIEAVNTGTGEPWPAAQIDAYFTINNALAAAYGLQPSDCCSHAEWAPGRKIDPAVASAVDGAWSPASINSAGTWSVDDIRAEAVRRAGTTPPPMGDDMQVRLLTLSDADAQFLAMTTEDGQALYCTWAGPASPAVDAAVAAHRAAAAAKGHPFEQRGTVAGLFPIVFVSRVLPYGDGRHDWTSAEFWHWVGG